MQFRFNLCGPGSVRGLLGTYASVFPWASPDSRLLSCGQLRVPELRMENGVTTAWTVSQARWAAEELSDKGEDDMEH